MFPMFKVQLIYCNFLLQQRLNQELIQATRQLIYLVLNYLKLILTKCLKSFLYLNKPKLNQLLMDLLLMMPKSLKKMKLLNHLSLESLKMPNFYNLDLLFKKLLLKYLDMRKLLSSNNYCIYQYFQRKVLKGRYLKLHLTMQNQK